MSASADILKTGSGYGMEPRIAWLPTMTNSYSFVTSPLARMMCSRSSRFIGPPCISQCNAPLEIPHLRQYLLAHLFGQHRCQGRGLAQFLGPSRAGQDGAPAAILQDILPLPPQAGGMRIPWLNHLSNVSCACCSNAGSDRTRRTASSCNARLCRSCTSWRASCARTRTCTTGLAWRERAAAVPAGAGCRASPASNANSPPMPSSDMTRRYVPMDGPGSPDSTAASVLRDMPTREAISTVPSPCSLRRRLSRSPNCKSSWR